nr:hypothetical protein [Tanacetum cinerariifolium]
MLESSAYMTYYAFASKEKASKPKYVRKKADFNVSPKQKPVQATKGTRIKTKAKVAKHDKKKQPTKKPKAKGLAVLSDVALTEAEQLKLATKRSKTDFHISHASGLGVPDVPIYVSKSDKESWGDSDEEDDDKDYIEDDADNNDDDNGGSEDHDDDKENVDERVHTPSDYELTDDEKIHNEENTNEEEEDEVTKELYDDVNVNLGNEDTEMTNADQCASEQKNSSQLSGFEQEEEDAHLTLTPVLNAQKIRVDCYMENKLKEAINKAIQAHNFDCREEAQAEKREYIELVDSTMRTIIKEEVNTQLPQIFPQAISDVATLVIEKNVNESLKAVVLTRSSSQPQSSYEAAATLSEFELKKILIDK